MASGQLVTWVLTAATLALLPRYLGPASMGHLGLAVSFGLVAATAGAAGIPVLITREVARDRARALELMPTAFWIAVVGGALAGAGSVLLAIALGFEGRGLVSVVCFAVTVPFNVCLALSFGVLQGAEVMRHQAVIDMANKLVTLALLCVIVWLDLGYAAWLAASVAVAIAWTVPSMRAARGAVPFQFGRFSPQDAAWMLRGGSSIVATELIVVVYVALDVLLLTLIAGESAAGIYATPARIWGTLLFFPTIAVTVIFPRLAAAAHDEAELRRIASLTIAVLAAVTLPLAALTAGAGPDGLLWLTGDDFRQSGWVLAVMAIALVPTAFNMVCHRVLLSLDRQRRWTQIQFGALLFKAALAAALIPLCDSAFGNPAAGAAASLAVAETGIAIAGARQLPRGLMNADVRSRVLRLVGASGASLAVMLVLTTAGFVVAAVAGAGTFAIVALGARGVTFTQLRSAIGAARGRGTALLPLEEQATVDTAPWPGMLMSHSRLKSVRAPAAANTPRPAAAWWPPRPQATAGSPIEPPAA
jgi:O-antigen/teichoic acid export membrane protein